MTATLEIISITLGWLYFICWSISFYPQLIGNFYRRSVTGLSVDFVIASFYGFLCYTISNACLYFLPNVREEYRLRHLGAENPNPLVALNDVAFAAHAMALTFLFCVQVFLFRKPGEGPSLVGLFVAVALTVLIIGGALAAHWVKRGWSIAWRYPSTIGPWQR